MFSSEPEFAPRNGVVCILTDLTEAEAESVKEVEEAKGRSCRMEAMH
ncbi:hypothetical protein AB0B92_13650 [Streptomyces hygroscopicus]